MIAILGLSATQCVHTIQFKGKFGFASATTVSDLRSITSDLNVLFDTGVFDDFVDRSVAYRMFDILPGAGNPVNLAGKTCAVVMKWLISRGHQKIINKFRDEC